MCGCPPTRINIEIVWILCRGTDIRAGHKARRLSCWNGKDWDFIDSSSDEYLATNDILISCVRRDHLIGKIVYTRVAPAASFNFTPDLTSLSCKLVLSQCCKSWIWRWISRWRTGNSITCLLGYFIMDQEQWQHQPVCNNTAPLHRISKQSTSFSDRI